MGWSPGWLVSRTIVVDMSGTGANPHPLNAKWTIVAPSTTPEDVAVHPTDGVIYETGTATEAVSCDYNATSDLFLTQNAYVRCTGLLRGRDGILGVQGTGGAAMGVRAVGQISLRCDGTFPSPGANTLELYGSTAGSLYTYTPPTTIAADKWYRVGFERLSNTVNFFWNPIGFPSSAYDPGTSALQLVYTLTSNTPTSAPANIFGDMTGSSASPTIYSGINNFVATELVPPGSGGSGLGPAPGGNNMIIPLPGDTGPGPGGYAYGEPPGGSGSAAQMNAYRRYKNIRHLSNTVNNLTLGV